MFAGDAKMSTADLPAIEPQPDCLVADAVQSSSDNEKTRLISWGWLKGSSDRTNSRVMVYDRYGASDFQLGGDRADLATSQDR